MEDFAVSSAGASVDADVSLDADADVPVEASLDADVVFETEAEVSDEEESVLESALLPESEAEEAEPDVLEEDADGSKIPSIMETSGTSMLPLRPQAVTPRTSDSASPATKAFLQLKEKELIGKPLSVEYFIEVKYTKDFGVCKVDEKI